MGMMTNNTPSTEHPKRKILYTLLLAVLLIAVFIITFVCQNAVVVRQKNRRDEAMRAEAIRSAAEDAGRTWKESEALIEQIVLANADLWASAGRGSREGAAGQTVDTAALVEKYVNFSEIMLRPEAVCGGYALLVRQDPASESGCHLVFKNDLIPDDTALVSDGLTWDAIRQHADGEKYPLTVQDTVYSYTVNGVPEMDGYLVLLTPKENLFIKSLSRSTYTIAVAILLLFGTAVAAASLCSYVRNNGTHPNQEERYRPSNIRRFTLLFCVIGVILIAICGWLDQSLNSLYDFSVRSRAVLDAAEENIDQHILRNSRDSQVVERIYLNYGNTIAAILDEQPEMRTADTLRSFCDRIGASSITLYDSQGKETVSSGDYIDLELGRDPLSATWEFRRILKGTPHIFRETETDAETGLNEMRLGIRINDVEEAGKYGAMIIALDPSMLEHDTEEEINTILDDMTVSGAQLWISDLETGRVLVSGDRELIGKSLQDLGMSEADLKDNLMLELRAGSRHFYLASSVLDSPSIEDSESGKERIIFYSEDLHALNYGSSSIFFSCIAFLLMYAILQHYALSDYTDEFWNTYKHFIPIDAAPAKKPGKDTVHNNVSGMKALWKALSDFWRDLPPGKKGIYTVEALTVYFLLIQIPVIFSSTEYAKDTVNYYISTGQWTRGMNLFAVAAIVNMAVEILFFVIVFQLVFDGLSLLAGTKGKTVFRLFSSAVRYIALFTAVILFCSYLGIERTTILTGIGAVSLALSLGAQDLISDVIAGVAIVFEGNFQVGEIVEIDANTGEVLEIGIRCTKILERDGDIVVISNRRIDEIINMTQHSSWYTCDFSVPSFIEIEELESMLGEELPKISAGDVRILSGPVYKGITEFNTDCITLRISTECKRDDYDAVREKVNRELQRFFRSKNILN